MAFKRKYAGAIWTHHALERLGQRGLTQEMAGNTFRRPDTSESSKNGGTEFTKKYGSSTVSVIAKQNEKKEWIIISCWIDPPLKGSIDYQKKQDYLRFKKASFWEKVWLTLKKQLRP